jgi:hypothetical protein
LNARYALNKSKQSPSENVRRAFPLLFRHSYQWLEREIQRTIGIEYALYYFQMGPLPDP